MESTITLQPNYLLKSHVAPARSGLDTMQSFDLRTKTKCVAYGSSSMMVDDPLQCFNITLNHIVCLVFQKCPANSEYAHTRASLCDKQTTKETIEFSTLK